MFSNAVIIISGFPLALSPTYDYALLGVVSFVLPVFLLILAAGKIFRRLMKRAKQADLDPATGYEMDPWGRGAEPGTQPPAGHMVGNPQTPIRMGAAPQGPRQFV